MPTEAELKAQHDALTKNIEAMKAQGEANAAQITQALADIKAIKQTNEALNRAAMDSAVGPSHECAFYLDVDDAEKAWAPDCYADTSNGTIRLFGHEVTRDNQSYYVPGLVDDVEARGEGQAELQRALADLQITRDTIRQLKHRGDKSRQVHTPYAEQQVRRALAKMPPNIRKIFADLTNFGADMMPYTVDADYERDLKAQHTLANVITQMSHPGGTLDIPFVSGDLQAFIDKIPTGDDPDQARNSSLGTTDDTIKCVEMACASQVHRNATEQSVVAMLPLLRMEMARAHSFADNNALINGNVSGSEIDTGLANWNVRGRMAVTAADAENQLYAAQGMRAHAFADSKTVDLGSKQTYAGFMEVANLLGIETLVALEGTSRIVFLVSPEFFFTRMFAWTEFQSFNDVGAVASLLTGTIGGPGPSLGLPNQVGYLFGRFPVCLNFCPTADRNASGVYDNLTATKTSMLAVDLARYQRWARNGVRAESDVDIRRNTVTLVSRQGRKIRRSKSSQPSAALGYNLDKTVA